MRTLLKILLVIAIVGIGALTATVLVKTRPEARRRPVSIGTPLVETMRAYPERRETTIVAMGTVVPAREVTLQPQVTGRVVEVSPAFMPGGRFREGETILKIDDRDYEIALEQARAKVSQASVDLKTERGRGAVARKEWDLLGAEIRTTPEGRTLALREPQLENARAALASARSALKKAELDLERTVIRAPFNAFVREKNVDVGQFVSASAPLATLAGTDRFWVRASVPPEKLPELRPADSGDPASASRVRIVQEDRGPSPRPVVRHGRVVRLLGDMEPRGRMARLLVSVDDPLGIESGDADTAPLLVDAFVRVEIEGPEIADAFPLPSRALRDDRRVWTVDDGNRLAFREVEPVWESADEVLVRGLDPGDRVILSGIGAPVAGMELRIGDPGNGTDGIDRARGDGERPLPDDGSASEATGEEATP